MRLGVCAARYGEFTAYYTQVDIATPGLLKPGRQTTPAGFYMNLPGQVFVVDFDGGTFDRAREITVAHLQAVLRKVSGTEVTLDRVHLATSFTDRARLVTCYRRGRVLLAGDAAHIHSALGGQGLNAGLGDAMNLGRSSPPTWLAMRPRGWSTATTKSGIRSVDGCSTGPAPRRPCCAPTPSSQALGAIVRDLVDTPDGATYFAEQLWGLALRYEFGDDHPLVGCSAPDVPLDDDDRLAVRLREGRGVLVDLAREGRLEEAIAPSGDRVRYAAAPACVGLDLSAMLVRPDGVVAWAGDAASDGEGLRQAAARWFGTLRPAAPI